MMMTWDGGERPRLMSLSADDLQMFVKGFQNLTFPHTTKPPRTENAIIRDRRNGNFVFLLPHTTAKIVPPWSHSCHDCKK